MTMPPPGGHLPHLEAVAAVLADQLGNETQRMAVAIRLYNAGVLDTSTWPDPDGRPIDKRAHMTAAVARSFIATAGGPGTRGVLVGCVVVAELMGDDGEPWIAIVPDPGSPVWRTLGLLHHAILDRERGILTGPEDTEPG